MCLDVQVNGMQGKLMRVVDGQTCASQFLCLLLLSPTIRRVSANFTGDTLRPTRPAIYRLALSLPLPKIQTVYFIFIFKKNIYHS